MFCGFCPTSQYLQDTITNLLATLDCAPLDSLRAILSRQSGMMSILGFFHAMMKRVVSSNITAVVCLLLRNWMFCALMFPCRQRGSSMKEESVKSSTSCPSSLWTSSSILSIQTPLWLLYRMNVPALRVHGLIVKPYTKQCARFLSRRTCLKLYLSICRRTRRSCIDAPGQFRTGFSDERSVVHRLSQVIRSTKPIWPAGASVRISSS